MKEALTLLFLIVSYNFLLWYITFFELTPIPFFPEDPEHVVLVLSYNSILYIAWLFGEREKVVQWLGYLFFVQIVALSIYFEDLSIIVRDLPPVILSFAITVLFESPKEKELKRIEQEREELLNELDKVKREKERVEVHLKLLTMKIKELEEEKEKLKEGDIRKEEIQKQIDKLKKELEEYKEKERRLLETNRRLFELLETLKVYQEPSSSKKKELANLRKERKKLIKEVVELQELISIYSEENEKLKEEIKVLKERTEKVEAENERLRSEIENLKRKKEISEGLKEVLKDILSIKVSEEVLRELSRLKGEERRRILREIVKLDMKEIKRFETLSTASDIYKHRFSGGRIYLKRTDDGFEIIGFLTTEDDKEKDRYIREVLSKLSERTA